MTVAAEDQIDPRNGARQCEIVVELFVADHDDDVRMLRAQIANGLARGSDRIAEMKDRLFDERLEVAAGYCKDADANSVYDENARPFESVRVRAQHGIADRLKTTLQLADSIIGIVVSERHRVDDAVEPGPLGTLIFIRPRR